ncbi:hypothetical protein [Polyangium mundeleinium]|uniref:DUF4149 domain-containing protein n=1 Tax=Polyangium mundeleinium TaxID=2995306 RepID=A0ABT5ELT1_9BACT|nr:hypothetical protein [Polyangium mundeleinium]MDC0742342.1 hypothetical protein [Polyangium mundeleinium]
MHPLAWLLSVLWLLAAVVVAVVRGVLGARQGRAHLAAQRIKSPTIYLFSAYLLVAALVTPKSPGESTSPLLWLAFAIPLANALAAASSVGQTQPKGLTRAGLALLHGGAVLAAAACILSLVSPRFVPVWLGGPGAP